MLTIQEEQYIELEIMQKIHLFCEENNIRYVMGFGTLLGAVRHKGFIPWDNDMDIFMPRTDFERFLELTKIKPINEHLYIEHYTTDSKYHYMCARVCDDRTKVNVPYIREQPTKLGIWVDVFPMDGVVANPLRRLYKRLLLTFHWGLFRADVYGFDEKVRSVRRVLKLIAIKLVPNINNRNNYRVDKISMNTYGEECHNLDHLFELPKGYKGIPKEDVENPILMKFDKYAFYGPRNYDEYLTAYFGNYMELPPVEKRIVHNIEAEWISEAPME